MKIKSSIRWLIWKYFNSTGEILDITQKRQELDKREKKNSMRMKRFKHRKLTS